MLDAQFVFVTEDARVMAMSMDGHLEDVTERGDLLPRSLQRPLGTQTIPPFKLDQQLDKRHALLRKFAA